MTILRSFAAGLAMLVLESGAVLAVDPAAETMVQGIYKTYMGKDAKGIPIDSARAKALLTPGLQKLIAADAKRAKAKGDVPELDGDPFVDAQDWDFSSYEVAMSDTGAGKARANVALTGASGARKVTLDLVKLKGGWRIDDMTGESGSLRGILGKK
jgi:hypothetical protein